MAKGKSYFKKNSVRNATGKTLSAIVSRHIKRAEPKYTELQQQIRKALLKDSR